MKHIEVAAAILCDDFEHPHRIFAAARGYGAQKGGWEFPGGKLEPGEAAEDAVKRELREEMELDITVGPLLDTVEYDYPDFHITMHCFLCKNFSGEPVLKEASEARWLTKNTLSGVNWLPADQTILSKLTSIMEE